MLLSSSSELPVQLWVGDLRLVSSGELLGERRGKEPPFDDGKRFEVVRSSTMPASSSSSSSSLASDLLQDTKLGELRALMRRRERGLILGLLWVTSVKLSGSLSSSKTESCRPLDGAQGVHSEGASCSSSASTLRGKDGLGLFHCSPAALSFGLGL